MNSLVEQTVLKHRLFDKGDRLIVALSGGADSVSLLDVLNSLKEKYNLTIFAAHLNHNLRGEEAKRDENFCKILCKNYNVELYIKNSDIKALAQQQKISEELCGRNERYAFFAELSEKLGAKVATAHTASDNAETLLFNLARGCSIGGISAIPPKRGNIIRPLIEVTRADVEKYCADHSLDFVTDSTNFTDDYTRNNIRHNIIPQLKSINPSFEKAALNLSESAREILTFLNSSAKTALEACKTDYGYDCRALMSLDSALLKRALIILIKNDYGVSLEQKHIVLLCDIIKNGGSVELSKLCTAVSKQGIFRIVQTNLTQSFEFKRLEKNLVFTFNGNQYSVMELSDSSDASESNISNISNIISTDLLGKNAVFRTRQSGDTFTYPKRKVTKPLRKVLNELKIPSENRDRLIVLAVDSTVLWCKGVGTSLEGLPKNTAKALNIKICKC